MSGSRQDSLGNPVTGGTAETLAAIDDFVEGFLAYETRAVRVLGAAEAEPDHCLANIYAGCLHLFAESPSGPRGARPFLMRAARTARDATPRERLLLALAERWLEGDIGATLRLAEEGVSAYPQDLVLAKIGQYHAFNRGEAVRMLRFAKAAEPAHALNAHLHGMLAFGYEQCHLLEEAERSARRALDLKPKEPWAQHAIAHVRLTDGRIGEGRAFLEDVAPTWTDLNSFMETHLFWHLALFYLSEGREADVLRLYDTRVWAREKTYSQDQIGAVSLLARMELAGMDVGERWQELGSFLRVRTEDTINPFLTLQFLYGLARAGLPEAEALEGAIRARAETGRADERAVWAEVARPAAAGLLAHARGEFESAAHHLSRALPRLQEAGGSHAQRDLFELVLTDALLRSGREHEAQRLLEIRRRSDPMGVPVNRALAALYSGLGLTEEARAAQLRASRRTV